MLTPPINEIAELSWWSSLYFFTLRQKPRSQEKHIQDPVVKKATKNKKEHINIQLFCSCNSTPLTNPFLSTTSIYTVQR
jgi:hypothetical protein